MNTQSTPESNENMIPSHLSSESHKTMLLHEINKDKIYEILPCKNAVSISEKIKLIQSRIFDCEKNNPIVKGIFLPACIISEQLIEGYHLETRLEIYATVITD